MASTPVIVIGKPLLKTYRGYKSRKERFDDWRAVRPFWGGVLLIAAGVLLAYIPFYTLDNFAFTGGTAELIGIIGLVFAFFVFLSGVAAITHPRVSTLAGMTGIVMSILSIIGGTFGGMGIGTFLGMVGGSLCVAWIQEEETVTLEGDDEAELRQKAQKYEKLLEEGDVDPSELDEEELDEAVEGLGEDESSEATEGSGVAPETPDEKMETPDTSVPFGDGQEDSEYEGDEETETETETTSADAQETESEEAEPETSDMEEDIEAPESEAEEVEEEKTKEDGEEDEDWLP